MPFNYSVHHIGTKEKPFGCGAVQIKLRQGREPLRNFPCCKLQKFSKQVRQCRAVYTRFQ